jgi:ribose 5-phosphate isomerase A
LPVEVVPMACELVAARLRAIGGRPTQRAGFVTDNGNLILDVAGLRIEDAAAMESQINQWPGVVTVGLFAHAAANIALVARGEGVQRIDPA